MMGNYKENKLIINYIGNNFDTNITMFWILKDYKKIYEIIFITRALNVVSLMRYNAFSLLMQCTILQNASFAEVLAKAAKLLVSRYFFTIK